MTRNLMTLLVVVLLAVMLGCSSQRKVWRCEVKHRVID